MPFLQFKRYMNLVVCNTESHVPIKGCASQWPGKVGYDFPSPAIKKPHSAIAFILSTIPTPIALFPMTPTDLKKASTKQEQVNKQS